MTAAQRQSLERAAQEKLEADRRQAEQAAAAAKAKEQQEAQAKAQAQREQQQRQQQQRQQQQAQAQAQAQVQPQRPPLRAGQVINLADEQRAQRAQQQRPARNNSANDAPPPPTVAASGAAVEGNINELRSASPDSFTIQIVSASNRANIVAAARGLTGRYWIMETRYNNRPWYILLSGDYPTRDAAQAAARRIPQSVSQGATPFAKSMRDVQGSLR